MLATSASVLDWAESDLIGGDIDDISDVLNDESAAAMSNPLSYKQELFGVVDETVSEVLLVLLLLLDGWSSSSVIKTGPWNRLFSSEKITWIYRHALFRVLSHYYQSNNQ